MLTMIDLHCHSTISDGLLTPEELVTYAASKGVRVMALTDHDDTDGLLIAEATAKQHGMTFINGVEISVTWHRRTLHIVGLNVNPEYLPLANGLKEIREGRHQRAKGIADGLEQVGITGSLDGAYSYARHGIISRTHFAQFIVGKGWAPNIRAVFKHYLVKGKPGYFEHSWASLEEAVSWIAGSGGIAVLAHPGRYDIGRTNMLMLLEEFRFLGGKAVEVVTGSHTVEQYQEYAKLARLFGLQASQGSDYHGPGHNYMDMGRLPEMPDGCVPVWKNWPDINAIVTQPLMKAGAY